MFSKPITIILSTLLTLATSTPLPSQPESQSLTSRSVPHISFVPNSSFPKNCEIGLAFDTSSSSVGLTIWSGTGATLGSTTTTGGTDHFDFNTQLPLVFVVDVPKIFSDSDVKDGLATLKWSYGKHKGAYSGMDYLNCAGFETGHTCFVSFDCSS